LLGRTAASNAVGGYLVGGLPLLDIILEFQVIQQE